MLMQPRLLLGIVGVSNAISGKTSLSITEMDRL